MTKLVEVQIHNQLLRSSGYVIKTRAELLWRSNTSLQDKVEEKLVVRLWFSRFGMMFRAVERPGYGVTSPRSKLVLLRQGWGSSSIMFDGN